MYQNHTIAVVVPAYNEEGLVGDVIDTMAPEADRLFVIDDRSTDETWSEIQTHAAKVNESRRGIVPAKEQSDAPFVVPIRKESNGGRGSCVKVGYKRALREGYDVVVVMDGDGQMDPDVLPRLVDPIVDGEADYSKGDRMRSRRTREGMSSWRTFGNTVLGLLTKLSSGYWGMSDSQNGYTAISRHALQEISVDDLYDGYGFLNDVLVTLNIHEMSVANVSHQAQYGDEESSIRYRTFVPLLSFLLLRCFFRRVRSRYFSSSFHPISVFFVVGLVAIVAGLAGVAVMAVGAALAIDLPLVVGHYTLLVTLAGGGALFAFGTAFDFRSNGRAEYRGTTYIEYAGDRENTRV
jgi:glycosyltransferase involved in cell wall biosynthesis